MLTGFGIGLCPTVRTTRKPILKQTTAARLNRVRYISDTETKTVTHPLHREDDLKAEHTRLRQNRETELNTLHAAELAVVQQDLASKTQQWEQEKADYDKRVGALKLELEETRIQLQANSTSLTSSQADLAQKRAA